MNRMDEVQRDFRERCHEIEHYLVMLRFVEESGAKIVSRDCKKQLRIGTTTLHVLKASVCLHLYNLIESTLSACLRRIAEEIEATNLRYVSLVDEWRRAWLKATEKLNDFLTPENRLKTMLYICDQIIDEATVAVEPAIPLNVDDMRIEKIVADYGISLQVPAYITKRVRHRVHNDLGTLQLIRLRRNELAHGHMSFAECGRELTVRELRLWRVIVVRYLRGVIKSFESYLGRRGFERSHDATTNGTA